MSDLIVIENDVPMVSSQAVADKFGKVHAKLIRDINNLDCSAAFKGANFGKCSFTNKMNRTYNGYMMTKDGFSFLCMGFTGKKAAKWKEEYINAFNAMEKALLSTSPLLDEINTITRKIEADTFNASTAGRILSNYKTVKPENEKLMQDAFEKVQLALF
jgi:Rha family phage regulatory protein